ncbi:alpha-adducin-like isoform X1 [Dysidea avara]|uniref:alpha-adducin-like isoform X1 n=1 Tax=Dysidea avara TaxID=196820 RepID=UPI003323A0DF
MDISGIKPNLNENKSQFSRVTGGATNIIPINDLREVNASKYTEAERDLRCKLAALYRLVDRFGWGHIIYNHITVKMSQDKEQFLINPFGLMYSEVTASSLVKVDLAGNTLDPGSTQLGCNKAGYMIHSAIHEGRPEIQCVIHLHSGPGAAVSAMSCGLLPISQEALIVGGVSYHNYRGIVVDEEEKQELIKDLGPTNKVMILRNHGLVALGSTIEEAFHYLFNLVRACEVQVQALSCGIANLLQVPLDVCGQVQNVVEKGGGGVSSCKIWGVGDLEFEALMRMLDNQGYNTGYPYKGMKLLQPLEETRT